MFPQIFGKYVLEREIAAGGMARVYLATLRGAVGFEKRLVVKQIRAELASDEAFVRRFVEEAKTTVELTHPNIVPVYELGVEQGVYYIAMEFCEGVTLSEMLRETGPLSAVEGAYVAIEILRALDYAHRKSAIVHRDVTPRNVMIDEEGAVRLIDFGIAAPVNLSHGTGVKVEIFGSPGHMPPEQVAGEALTPATDVFAVAALLVEAWTGDPPFRRETPAACLEALRTPAPRLVGITELEPLADLIASALALSQSERPQSAEALARPLREFVKSVDLGDVARRVGERARRTRRALMASSPALSTDPVEGPRPGVIEATRPRAPSIGDTQTFAAQRIVAEWTRKLPSVPPPSEDAVVEPPPPEPSTRALASAAAEPASLSPKSFRVWLISAAMAVLVAAVWWGARVTPTVASGVSASAVAPPAISIEPSASPPLVVPPPPSGSERAIVHPVPSGSATRVASTSDAGASEATGKSSLVLTATPPSSVIVNGRAQGTTPVTQQVPGGTYSVVFDNAVLGLRRAATVTVAAGKIKKVHVDFTDGEGKVFIF